MDSIDKLYKSLIFRDIWGENMILVVFGSASDKDVYAPIIETLKKKDLKFEFRICSAHRTPDMLKDILSKKYKMVIAGAGLAAHLPGVVASHTTSPVVGVPCTGNFAGLDAFLSVAQMPGGMPVLAAGVDDNPAEAEFLFKKWNKVNVIGDKENKRVKKCLETLKNFSIDYEVNGEEGLEIRFYDLNTAVPAKEAINVALKDKSSAEDVQTFLEKSKGSFHVGLNRGDNAALFAVQLIKPDDLEDYRTKAAEKVKEADEGERVKA